MQNILTDRKTEIVPMAKASASLTDVMVMDIAASEKAWRIRSSTVHVTSVLLQAATIMNMSSSPIPGAKV